MRVASSRSPFCYHFFKRLELAHKFFHNYHAICEIHELLQGVLLAGFLFSTDLSDKIQIFLTALQGLPKDNSGQTYPNHLFEGPFYFAFVELPGTLIGHFFDFLLLIVDFIGSAQHLICFYLVSLSQKSIASRSLIILFELPDGLQGSFYAIVDVSVIEMQRC